MMRMLVVGSGQMGAGIAQTAATFGVDVLLHDRDESLIKKAIAQIGKRLDRAVDKGNIDEVKRARILAQIHARPSLDDCAADVVLEAITEHQATKFEMFRVLDEMMPFETILASNTSAISITALAAQTKRPDRVIGMHFMNPVPVMQLVEIVRGLETSTATLATITNLARQMEKTPVTVDDAPGFISNRVLMPMINEAVCALNERVADVEGIDTIMRLGMNHPLGPLALADLIGLDTCLAIMDVLHEGFGDTKYRASTLLRRYVAAGRLGRKTGRGFYEYNADGERLEAHRLLGASNG